MRPLWVALLLLTAVRSDRSVQHILSGDPAGDEYRYAVSLEYLFGHVFCTGVVVGDRAVLTAAHCTIAMDISMINVCLNGSCSRVEQAVTPEEYDPFVTAEGNDLALLRLQSQLDGAEAAVIDMIGITPPDTVASILGYGITEAAVYGEKQLRVVDANITSNEECRSLRLDGVEANENLVCGDGNYDGSAGGACDGDSGGPLVVKTADGANLVVGIASYIQRTDEFCNPSFETVFMRLSGKDHRRFLNEGAQSLGISLNVYPATGTMSSPENTLEVPVWKLAFPAAQWDAVMCRNVMIQGVSKSSDLIISQEHAYANEYSIAWIDNVQQSQVRVCVRARFGRLNESTLVTVWLTTIDAIVNNVSDIAMRSEISISAGKLCREFDLPQYFGSKVGVFVTPAYDPGTTDGVSVESSPVTMSVFLDERKVLVCAMRSLPSYKREIGTPIRTGVLMMRLSRLIFMTQLQFEVEGRGRFCKQLSMSEELVRSRPMLLTSVNTATEDQGLTTWFRWTESSVQVCCTIVTTLPQPLQVGIRVVALRAAEQSI
eukprot:Plantae.Rhodophyta-Purpureofilum_apyrenoidigerum.ctg20615.p1 GENE.Plantae.Rhodophyta-Purpureofilum_apyrenoidigerum.ctg20615~~Plantae.Rhodophyta-Purpureofilum_apyrenoidigerum.ctg20615.p1  ORF type:complete len:545 (+),score=57.51 Plantae.Rhodophyta-Purpureofilum_apyrenoidigerum.ctg20615:2801-4435(+)